MDRTTIAVAVAMIISTVGAGISAVPVAAVMADCSADYNIADSEPLVGRSLAAGENETGKEEVKASEGDEQLQVELVSDDDKLEFGIFEKVDGCSRSTNVAPTLCESDVVLDTTGPNQTDSETCTLEAPDSDSRAFYVVFENIEDNGDELEYKAWVS